MSLLLVLDMARILQRFYFCVAHVARPAALHRFLQAAIELEHSTIPPYLTAYFTLKLGRNEEIAAIIRGIVIEEMLHMATAANVLLALGGSPQIDKPRFIPRYPGRLPMNVGDEVIVGLAKFSKELVYETFMKIEEPEQPLDFPARAAVEAGVPELEFATIGEFYQAIIEKLRAFGDGIFVGIDTVRLRTRNGSPRTSCFRLRMSRRRRPPLE